MKSRTEILVPIAAIQAVPIAVIAWYRLHRYAWYRYSAIVSLLDLFHNNTYLIAELVGLSDDEIARKIKGWAKEKDKLGKPLIENPENGLKSRFAKELKANGMIKQSEKTFRIKL